MFYQIFYIYLQYINKNQAETSIRGEFPSIALGQ